MNYKITYISFGLPFTNIEDLNKKIEEYINSVEFNEWRLVCTERANTGYRFIWEKK